MPDAPKRPGTLTFVAIVLFVLAVAFSLNALSTGFYACNVALNPAEPKANAKHSQEEKRSYAILQRYGCCVLEAERPQKQKPEHHHHQRDCRFGDGSPIR